MRKEIYRMSRASALSLLSSAEVVHLSSTTSSGEPVLRTLHGVVVDDYLAFHGAAAGEKTDCVGRPAVLSAEEVVAQIPSYFVDPERACPATTFYRSVQLHGILRRVDDLQEKARILAALMEKYQPEGGFVPLDAAHPLYQKAVQSILIVKIPLDALDGKAKLGQNRSPREIAILVEKLWQRGLPQDPRAIARVLAANPRTPLPDFLQGPKGTKLECALEAADVDDALRLLDESYWNVGVSEETLRVAHLASPAWVGARDEAGRLIASARAISDVRKWACVYDVVVAPSWQRKGLGRALLRLLLDHPAVRGAANVWLKTLDAQAFYRGFGFREPKEIPRAYTSQEMILRRPAP